MVLVTLAIVWVAVISNQTVVINVMNRLILLNVSVKIKCSNCVHYNSCNYRYSDFYDLISLLMIFVVSKLNVVIVLAIIVVIIVTVIFMI